MSDFPTYEIGRLVPQAAKITEFPGCVLIEVQPMKSGQTGFALRTEDFAAMISECKGTDFVFEPLQIPIEVFYHGVMDEYLDDYVNRPHLQSDYYGAVDIRVLVEMGAFQNIVRDFTSDDGYLYDLNGDRVYRSFHVELGSNDYDAQAIHKFLAGYKKIKGLGIEKVPHYNVDPIGKCQVEFNYYPDPEEFYELVEIDKKDCILGTEYAIVDRLGLEKFSRNSLRVMIAKGDREGRP